MKIILTESSLYFGAFSTIIGSLALIVMRHDRRNSILHSVMLWSIVALLGAALTWAFTGTLNGLLFPIAATAAVVIAARMIITVWTPFGLGLLGNRLYVPVCTMIFVHGYASNHDWSISTWILYWIAGILVVASPIVATLLGELSNLCLRFPRRDAAFRAIAAGRGKTAPKVSIHVPCYSEPPHLVIATLDAISRLKYPNFEVLVIDNNTKDPRLWKPVEAHCATLGERFRFFHVDPISGAKAGALNFILPRSAEDAEIIAVIDADYIAEPDFLDKYVPLFADPKMGFVQTSHDYRGWEDSRFLSGAYYEYLTLHKLSLPAMSEFRNGYTVGTMCLLRREALERAGGWDEWCLTEDSELAVRIHAAGYLGHTFADTSGRGLIPETMTGIKKQQFRWTAGPVQQFLMHWRLYFGMGRNNHMHLVQRLLELRHSFERAPIVASFLLGIAMPAYCVYAILNHSTVTVSAVVPVLLAAEIFRRLADKWVMVKLIGSRRFSDYFYSILTGAALEWTYISAFVTPFFTSGIPWHRTNKFQESFSVLRAFQASRVETLLAVAHLAAGLALAPFARFAPVDLIALGVMGLLMRGVSLMSTLAMALLGEHELYAHTATRSASKLSWVPSVFRQVPPDLTMRAKPARETE